MSESERERKNMWGWEQLREAIPLVNFILYSGLHLELNTFLVFDYFSRQCISLTENKNNKVVMWLEADLSYIIYVYKTTRK